MAEQITVRKLDESGVEVFRYSGKIIRYTDSAVILEAIFDMEEVEFPGLIVRSGDRFVETHYSDRWYNVLAIYAIDTTDLKGWYCNISRPAVIENSTVSAEDLALDLVVLPDGRQFVLDEDEYADLDLNSADREKAQAALKELQQYAETLSGPFEVAERS